MAKHGSALFLSLQMLDFAPKESTNTNQNMTSIKQREELHATIWKIANDVRGAVDGWDFKQYVLGTPFYRFISEHFAAFVEKGDKSYDYASMSDDEIESAFKDDLIKTKGYFIYPSQLFVNVAKTANTNENLNTDLAAIFNAIESSAQGKASEKNIRGLFADFDTTSNRLGNTVADKNRRLAAVIKGVESLDFGDFADNEIDLFGDAYEFLISNYAANAGKSGGEFFTPQSVSKLIARLALLGQNTINKVYDPACGSGSLLLQVEKTFGKDNIDDGFYGQEINHTTYNLARMNMFLHGIEYNEFNIALGDTLLDPLHALLREMDRQRRSDTHQRPPIRPGRRAGARLKSRLRLCAPCAQLPFCQRASSYHMFPRHLLSRRRRTEDPALSGGEQLCGERDLDAAQPLFWYKYLRLRLGALEA